MALAEMGQAEAMALDDGFTFNFFLVLHKK